MGSAVQQWGWFADAQESRFQAAKISEMCSAVMKGLRFADTQESCFEAWKRSHIVCSALLCGRFDYSQESRFQASKRSNMCSAVGLGGRSAEFPNSVSSSNTFRYGLWRSARGLFDDSQNGIFRFERMDKSITILKRDDLLMLRKRVFTVRNVDLWAVLSSKEVNLLMLKKSVFWQRNEQKCAVQSCKDSDFSDI